MTRVFRKYSRTLLMVFMALLLVAFLLQDVLYKVGRDAAPKQTLGSAFGGDKITSDVLRRVSRQMSVCRMLLPSFGFSDRPDDEIDFYLLTEEANRNGVHVSREYVMEMLRLGQVDDERMQRISSQLGLSYDSIYDALGGWLAAREYATLQVIAVGASIPEIETRFRDSMQNATVSTSVLDARAFLSDVADPSDAELVAFFDEAKARKTAHEDEKLVFGYQQPDRVQIEWLYIEPEKLTSTIRVSEAEARHWHEDHQAQYFIQPPKQTPMEGEDPPPEPERIPKSYEQAKDDVKRDLRLSKAVEEAQRVLNQIQEELNRPWQSAAIGPDGFAVAPATATVSFEDIKAKYAQYPIEIRKTDLGDQTALRKFVDLQMASTSEGGSRISGLQLAFRVKGIFTPPPTNPGLTLVPGQPSPLLTQARGNAGNRSLVLRVVAVAPSGPPESLDPLRDQVKNDWKLVKAFELAGVAAKKVAERAKQVGLAKAVEEDEALKAKLTAAGSAPAPAGQSAVDYVRLLGPQDSAITRRAPVFSSARISSAKLGREIFETADATSSAPSQKVFSAAVGGKQSWVVAELKEVRPLYESQISAQLPTAIETERSGFQRTIVQQWASREALRARTGFVPSETFRKSSSEAVE